MRCRLWGRWGAALPGEKVGQIRHGQRGRISAEMAVQCYCHMYAGSAQDVRATCLLHGPHPVIGAIPSALLLHQVLLGSLKRVEFPLSFQAHKLATQVDLSFIHDAS